MYRTTKVKTRLLNITFERADKSRYTGIIDRYAPVRLADGSQTLGEYLTCGDIVEGGDKVVA